MILRRAGWLIAAGGGLGGCARQTLPGPALAVTSSAAGVLPAAPALNIDAGVSYLRLTMEARDSVTWSFETKPEGCATPAVSPGRIEIARRDKHCSTRWDIRVPLIEDVRARVSVGNVDVSAPIDRALRLEAGVGSVRFRLDARELRGGKTPGSGERLEFGDLSTLPRLDVRTDVGWIHAETQTVKTGGR